jgi:hypothetical protein
MSRLGALLRALNPRTRGRDAPGAAAARTSKALRVEVRTLREEVRGLAVQLDALMRQQEQLGTLLEEEGTAAARLDQLAGILNPARVSAHVREAIAKAALVERPLPHAIVPNFLPADVYDAAVAAIPAPLFFERDPSRTGTLPVPPKLAPSHAVVTWTFLSDLATAVLAPALDEHFLAALLVRNPQLVRDMPECAATPLSAGPGYLLRLTPGKLGRSAAPDRSCIRMTLFLARPGDSEDFGWEMRMAEGGGVLQIPFQPNVALVTLDPTDAHERMTIPDTAPAGTIRHWYVMPLGGVQEGG